MSSWLEFNLIMTAIVSLIESQISKNHLNWNLWILYQLYKHVDKCRKIFFWIAKSLFELIDTTHQCCLIDWYLIGCAILNCRKWSGHFLVDPHSWQVCKILNISWLISLLTPYQPSNWLTLLFVYLIHSYWRT